MSVEFDDFRKVVIDGIKFKILFPAPFDSFRQSFAGAAGPENEFIAIAFPFLEIFNQCLVGLAQLRPFVVTQGTIKINSDNLIRKQCYHYGYAVVGMVAIYMNPLERNG